MLIGTGTTGRIYKTTDYGLTWNSLGVALAGEADIDFLTYLRNNVVIGSTYPNSKVIRSTNGGTSWSDLGQFGTGTFMSNCATSGAGVAIICESNIGHCWQTVDYGANWLDLGRMGGQNIIRIAYLENGIYVGGTSPNGKVVRSTEYGLGDETSYTFTNVQDDHALTATYASVSETDSGSSFGGSGNFR